jgi:hypothetical protein
MRTEEAESGGDSIPLSNRGILSDNAFAVFGLPIVVTLPAFTGFGYTIQEDPVQ